MPTGSLRQKNYGWAQGDGTKGNQYLHQLLLSFTTKFCSRINFMTKKKKEWRRKRNEGDHIYMQKLPGVEGHPQGRGAELLQEYTCWATSPVQASSVAEGTKSSPHKGKYPFKLHLISIPLSLTLRPIQPSAYLTWPWSTLIVLLCFSSNKTIRSLFLAFFFSPFGKRTAEQKVAGVLLWCQGCLPDC